MILQSNKADTKQKIDILHFNDVYEIEPSNMEPVGGAARFVYECKKFKQERGDSGYILFSGDLFSPSTLSVLYKGEQMLDPINACGIDVACVGNHEFDFGLDIIESLFRRCNFPWLCSNIFNVKTGSILANNHAYYIDERNGIKIGIMGLAEGDWLHSITEIDMSVVRYEDFIKCGKELSQILKEDYGCELIIALTHMRVPNDRKLAMHVPEIDLILGGHDHIIVSEKINESLFLKSGTDFKNYQILEIEKGNYSHLSPEEVVKLEGEKVFIIKNQFKIKVEVKEVSKAIPEDESIKKHVDFYVQESEKEMSKVIGISQEPLDTRFAIIRTEETNFCNFYADVIRKEVQADIAIFNSGTVRSDCIFPQGEISMQILNKALPFPDIIVVQLLKGVDIIVALENGVSKWPSFDGRFPIVSNIAFEFDGSKPPNERVNKQSIKINGAPLDLNKAYTTATKWFVSLGRDGYDVFIDKPFTLDYENGLPHLQILISFFKSLEASQKINKHQIKKSHSPLIEPSSPNPGESALSKDIQTKKKSQSPSNANNNVNQQETANNNSFRFIKESFPSLSLADLNVPSLENTPSYEERNSSTLQPIIKKKSSSFVSASIPSMKNIHMMRSVARKPSRIEKIDSSGLVKGIKVIDGNTLIIIGPVCDKRIVNTAPQIENKQ